MFSFPRSSTPIGRDSQTYSGFKRVNNTGDLARDYRPSTPTQIVYNQLGTSHQHSQQPVNDFTRGRTSVAGSSRNSSTRELSPEAASYADAVLSQPFKELKKILAKMQGISPKHVKIDREEIVKYIKLGLDYNRTREGQARLRQELAKQGKTLESNPGIRKHQPVDPTQYTVEDITDHVAMRRVEKAFELNKYDEALSALAELGGPLGHLGV
jgi:hypothetical protein